ncbi:hypothetical protein T4D_6936 [Trichinella pseudospiralis]|uniref:Uncharacterized protein n=1 Tax=Trichinella pseudospiralis TaxID=6337 RepID=A0A0V1FBG1_TRIPS|nr:hypothetical protein T4D_6936 [Trichinella pseudospiralis]
MEISVSQAHRYNSVPLHKYAIIKTFTPFIQKSNYNYATMILPKIILALKSYHLKKCSLRNLAEADNSFVIIDFTVHYMFKSLMIRNISAYYVLEYVS